MKILLDECVPKDFQKSLASHDCYTVPQAGFAGKKNGELLTLAEQAGFELLLTVDQGLQYQQSMADKSIALLVVYAKSNKLTDLLPQTSQCLRAIGSIKPGQVVRVG